MKFSIITFFTFVFLATFFFDDPYTSMVRRILYSCFLYLSIFEIYLFCKWKSKNRNKLKIPSALDYYYYCVYIVICVNLIADFVNPYLNFITLFNYPYALMTIVPVFALEIGYFTNDVSKIFKLFFKISFLFIGVCLLPIKPVLKFYEASICAYVILPLSIYFFYKKKYFSYCVFLITAMVIFSFFSDIRTIFLRVILFLCLVISLSVVKKFTTAKALIIMVVAFVIFQALANMQFYLDLFADELHIKQFNADDTRTFLYTELFDDLNTKQLFFGKGFLGTYFSEYFLLLQKTGETNGDSYIRFTVEVGFLQLILKGGFVFFLLYTLPMIYAAILGIFKGYNNRLIFMLSVFILNEFFLMFFENIPSYTINFFILFFLSGYIIKFVKNMEVKPKQNYTKSVFFDKDKKQLLTNNLDSILSQTP